jgi:hypothetical protein
MTSQYLPFAVETMLNNLNIDPRSVTWNVNNTGLGVSLNINWTFGAERTTYENNRRWQTPTRNNWRWKKSPSTLRHHESRRQSYLRRETERSASPICNSSAGQDIGTRSQVSVNAAANDTCSVRPIKTQTETVAMANMSVQTTTTIPTTHNTGTQCLVPKLTDSANQTVRVIKQHCSTQTETNTAEACAISSHVQRQPVTKKYKTCKQIKQELRWKEREDQRNSRQRITEKEPDHKIGCPAIDPEGIMARVEDHRMNKDGEYIYTLIYPNGPYPFNHMIDYHETQLNTVEIDWY